MMHIHSLIESFALLLFLTTCSYGQPGRHGQPQFFQGEQEQFYLIPMLTTSCLPKGLPEVIKIRPQDVQLSRRLPGGQRTNVLTFPGCFELDMNVELKEAPNTNLVLFESFKWMQSASGGEVSTLELGCQDADMYGCGGIGNRCFYCDVCEGIKGLNDTLKHHEKIKFQCPTKPGSYKVEEKRCIRDWGDLDKDKDGTPDFMKDKRFEEYERFLEGMKVAGYGSMRLTIYIATNATQEQHLEMQSEKRRLSGNLQRTLNKRLNERELEKNWAGYYKRVWLPKIVTRNMKACVDIYFNMCKYRRIRDKQELDQFECL